MMKFIEDLKKELKKQHLSDAEIEDIIKDHEDMMKEALEEGHQESDVILRFGDPALIAKELSKSSNISDEDNMANDTYQLWKSYTPSEESFSLVVKLVSEDLTIQPSKDDHIRILYKGRENIEKYHISYTKGDLNIETPKLRSFSLFRNHTNDMKFIIEVPKELDFKTCNQHGVSSDLLLHDLEISLLTINTTSGDCDIKDSILTDSRWNTVSGDLKASRLHISNLVVSMVSGDLNLEEVHIESDLSISTVSGDIDIKDSKAETVNFNTVSGDMEAKDFYIESVKFKSVSGDCDIQNKDKTPISVLRSSSISGEIHIKS